MGSSPLARGPLCVVVDHAHGVGLIPARAGTTAGTLTRVAALGAHPRSRGDHSGHNMHRITVEGSSPLARGPHLLTWGFTPYISKIESL